MAAALQAAPKEFGTAKNLGQHQHPRPAAGEGAEAPNTFFFFLLRNLVLDTLGRITRKELETPKETQLIVQTNP